MSSNLTQERLQSLLDYDPETGAFTWKVSRGKAKAGSVAGCLSRAGYITILIDGVRFSAHRLVFFYASGDWPSKEVDHINGVRSDNRKSNLRDVSRSENCQNTGGPSSNNTSGRLGVTWNKAQGKWQSQIQINRKNHYLGLFTDLNDAHSAYLKAKDELHPTHSRLRTKP